MYIPILDDTEVVYIYKPESILFTNSESVCIISGSIYVQYGVWLHGYIYISILLMKTIKLTFDYFDYVYWFMIPLCSSATRSIKNLFILIKPSIIYLPGYDYNVEREWRVFHFVISIRVQSSDIEDTLQPCSPL